MLFGKKVWGLGAESAWFSVLDLDWSAGFKHSSLRVGSPRGAVAKISMYIDC